LSPALWPKAENRQIRGFIGSDRSIPQTTVREETRVDSIVKGKASVLGAARTPLTIKNAKADSFQVRLLGEMWLGGRWAGNMRGHVVFFDSFRCPRLPSCRALILNGKTPVCGSHFRKIYWEEGTEILKCV